MSRPMQLAGVVVGLFIIALISRGFAMFPETEAKEPQVLAKQDNKDQEKAYSTATFGNGCFWCTEAIFQQLKGVSTVKSGYIGGTVKDPTYKQVCEGDTGHAEAIQITFDPKVISYAELLEVFWQTHDPTTLNQQGADVGTQYRSAIFYYTPEQKKLAEEYKQKLDKSGAFGKPIVTEIVAATIFYPAEDYHQNYYKLNGSQPYCRAVIKPKMDKFKKVFGDKMKKE